MYLPAHFREDRVEVMAELMRRHPLAALVTAGAAGLSANHLPLLYDPEPAPFGTLRGHLARANPQWREARPEFGALVIFQGPQAYVSPSFYPSKQEHGRVVPTWNYIVVHAQTILTVHDDVEWLRSQVSELTSAHEAAFAEPWSVGDAPPEYIEGLLKAIVGIELRITSLEGKWKASQNRPGPDREGVAAGLSRLGGEFEEMGKLVRFK